MAVEIERKFLVTGSDYQQSDKKIRIIQGYLSIEPDRIVRVRIWDDKGFIAVKSSKTGIRREEYEYEIPLADALEMLENLCSHPVIDKIRHIISYKGFTWEVDEFLGENEGLVIAEIELPDEDTLFERPGWIGEEVTFDRKYFNSSLVTFPFLKW